MQRHAICLGAVLTWIALSVGPVSAQDPFVEMGVAPVTTGEAAPPFALDDLAGDSVSLESFRGKAVLLNFWATWCIPCREEMPHLEALFQRHRGDGLVVVAVSEDTGRVKRVRRFVDKLGLTYPVLWDLDGDAGKAYRVSGLPATVLIGPDGTVRGRIIGFRDWTGDAADRLVRHLLGTQPE